MKKKKKNWRGRRRRKRKRRRRRRRWWWWRRRERCTLCVYVYKKGRVTLFWPEAELGDRQFVLRSAVLQACHYMLDCVQGSHIDWGDGNIIHARLYVCMYDVCIFFIYLLHAPSLQWYYMLSYYTNIQLSCMYCTIVSVTSLGYQMGLNWQIFYTIYNACLFECLCWLARLLI